MAQGGRLVVAAANAPAEARGITPGMPVADARARLPMLRVADAEPAASARALAAVAGWCTRYTPWTAVNGPDGAFLDVTGCAHLLGGEAALLADLGGRLEGFGLEARAALAETPGAAWAMARFGGGDAVEIVLPGAARAVLAPLPVAALRLAPADAAALSRLGLKRVGDLYDLPRAALARRFGDRVARRLDQALGQAPDPVSPRPPVAPHSTHRAFAEPILLGEEIAAALDGLLAGLCARLSRAGRGARRLALALARVDGSRVDLAIGTSAPARDPRHLARLFAEHLVGIDPEFGIESMILTATATEALGPHQLRLDGPADGRPAVGGLAVGGPAGGGIADGHEAGIAPLVDHLGNRLGAEAVMRFAPRRSHLPERAVRRAPAFADGPAGGESGERMEAPIPTGPRPLRLLDPPEPVEAVAPVPDDPPLMFRWRRAVHRVARADGPERIAPEWWREAAPPASAEPGPARETRDYYRVEDADGQRFWLYRHGLYRPGAAPAWFLHGFFA